MPMICLIWSNDGLGGEYRIQMDGLNDKKEDSESVESDGLVTPSELGQG